MAYDAAEVVAVGLDDGEGGGTGALGDSAAVVACYAAMAITVLDGVDGDGGRDAAAADSAAIVVAHDAAGVQATGDAGIGEGKVVDVGTTACIAEESLVSVF